MLGLMVNKQRCMTKYDSDAEQKDSMSGHEFKVQDVLVPFHQRFGIAKKDDSDDRKTDEPPVLQRYCHVYRQGELADLFNSIPWIKIEDAYFDTGNCELEPSIIRKLLEYLQGQLLQENYITLQQKSFVLALLINND